MQSSEEKPGKAQGILSFFINNGFLANFSYSICIFD
jgi:hypothetical protein